MPDQPILTSSCDAPMLPEWPRDEGVHGSPKHSLCVLYDRLLEIIDTASRICIAAHQPEVDVHEAQRSLFELYHEALQAHSLFALWHEEVLQGPLSHVETAPQPVAG